MRLVRTSELTEGEHSEIWSFLQRHFDTTQSYVRNNLTGRAYTVLYRDTGDGTLCGFSVVDVRSLRHEGRRVRILYTGLVALDPQYRGRGAIHRVGLRIFLREKLRHPLQPMFWAFGAISYKSYLLMARNLPICWPHRDRPTPRWEGGLLDRLGRHYLGSSWDLSSGTGRLANRVPECAQVTPEMLTDSDIRFFAERNPGSGDGQALLCLAPLNGRNWVRALGRMLAKRAGLQSACRRKPRGALVAGAPKRSLTAARAKYPSTDSR